MESARLIAGLTRLVGDVGTAEELAQDTLVIALEQWPRDGVPDNPGAWLMATAKHRAVDLIRRRVTYDEKLREIGRDLSEAEEPDLAESLDDHVGDDLLRLIFMACHPSLSTESRVALTLRLLGGLSTAETARALLVPEATVAQRIVRAKKTLTGVRFELPTPAELADRLASVLEVVYLIFNEGYSATAGDDWIRPSLCAEAQRLGRILAGLAPAEPEVHGLVSLMEIQASRLPARTGPDGAPILLLDQDRRRLGPAADPARPGRARRGGAAGRRHGRARAVRAAGRDRRLPRPRRDRGRHRLGPHRRAVPGARCRVALAGGRAQPRRRGRHGGGSGAGPRGAGAGTGRAGPGRLCPAAGGTGRPARPARPPGRGAAGVRARRGAHPQRAGAHDLPGPGRRPALMDDWS